MLHQWQKEQRSEREGDAQAHNSNPRSERKKARTDPCESEEEIKKKVEEAKLQAAREGDAVREG
eukprot:12409203-Karenia_brevis.AAC.1